ncbi:hypothetical protein CC80DRAFT_98823 [Byssothecium circinans]|uniref:Cora-domain-containing protein n=1 Tax=Byssothecium circinans TaxID=147558 RepID=A0A6A5UDR8_9PLEO|nr:hypothetical protein CC80DRAFT_98823 [Byssothecium circinans]
MRRRATQTRVDQDVVPHVDWNTVPQGEIIKEPPLPPPPHSPSPPPSQSSFNEDFHGPFIPCNPIRSRASSSALSADNFSTMQLSAYIESLQTPTSTLEEFEYFLGLPTKGKEPSFDPYHALLRAIHDDTLSLVDILRVSLGHIREATMNENLMQQRVGFWRNLLHHLNFSLDEIDQQMREFVHFAYEPDVRTEPTSRKLATDTRQMLRNCMDLIDRSSDSLRAEMQIVDNRRSIAEAESISKLTELAFVFIPLSFVGSVYGVDFRGVDHGVPVYQFAVVAVAFVVVAYAVRLSIRSSRLIQYKNETFEKIRDEAGLQYSEPIPTRTFLAWAGKTTSHTLLGSLWKSITIFAPFVLVLAIIAAILSPIIMLWLRGINKGFSIAITLLLLVLDAVLVYPVITNASGKFEVNPRAFITEIKENRENNRKRREKILKWQQKQKSRTDLESRGAEESESSDGGDEV